MSADSGSTSSKASVVQASRLEASTELPFLSDAPSNPKRGVAFWLVFLALAVATALNALESVSHIVAWHDSI
jgi:hypothetical protein